MMTILQIVSDTAAHVVSAATTTATPEKITLWGLLSKGGWLMYPLYVLFFGAIFVFFERLLTIRKASKIDPNFMHVVRDHIVNGNLQAAKSFAKIVDSPVAKIISKGLSRLGSPLSVIEKSMENTGRLELYNLERNLNILSLIAGIAPMFGFLGTIVGMVQLFYEINTTGNFELNVIAGGIYVKMITSGTGLIIGLLAYIAYNYLSTQVDKTANKMEAAIAEFLDIMQEPTQH
ncbi:MAG: MotA/TolQ/ExbB proton channel family protein [Chitinophagaceae bacterium]|jgi:biopolymer transport protein ExbB|nr:MotA/TolQ/ExbB proton channel family protein [Chitinophagaceae bacterium]